MKTLTTRLAALTCVCRPIGQCWRRSQEKGPSAMEHRGTLGSIWMFNAHTLPEG